MQRSCRRHRPSPLPVFTCVQVRVAQLCGSELDGLTVSQLEELERMQTEAIR